MGHGREDSLAWAPATETNGRIGASTQYIERALMTRMTKQVIPQLEIYVRSGCSVGKWHAGWKDWLSSWIGCI